jgi:hypothetical protein
MPCGFAPDRWRASTEAHDDTAPKGDATGGGGDPGDSRQPGGSCEAPDGAASDSEESDGFTDSRDGEF